MYPLRMARVHIADRMGCSAVCGWLDELLG
jgi:hypothetical protein